MAKEKDKACEADSSDISRTLGANVELHFMTTHLEGLFSVRYFYEVSVSLPK